MYGDYAFNDNVVVFFKSKKTFREIRSYIISPALFFQMLKSNILLGSLFHLYLSGFSNIIYDGPLIICNGI